MATFVHRFDKLGVTEGQRRRLALEAEHDYMKGAAENLAKAPAETGKAQELIRRALYGGLHPGRIAALTEIASDPHFLDAFTPDERQGLKAYAESASSQRPVAAPPLSVPGSYLFHGATESVVREFELGPDGKTWVEGASSKSTSPVDLRFELREFKADDMKWTVHSNAPLPLTRKEGNVWVGHQGDPQNGSTFTFTANAAAPLTLEVVGRQTQISKPSSYDGLDYSAPASGTPLKPGARMRTVETRFVASRPAEFLAPPPQEPKHY